MAKAIAIDSPVGAGGTTLIKRIKSSRDIEGVATSLLYRGFSEAMWRENVSPLVSGADFVADWLADNSPRFALLGDTVLLDGDDITGVCRTPQNDKGSSKLAGQAAARAIVNQRTVEAVDQHPADLVATEGRNECLLHLGAKTLAFGLYLTAAPETRAIRRAHQRGTSDVSAVLTEVVRRDKDDMTRELEPLGPVFDIARVVTGADQVPSPEEMNETQLIIPTDHLAEREVLHIAEQAILNYREYLRLGQLTPRR